MKKISDYLSKHGFNFITGKVFLKFYMGKPVILGRSYEKEEVEQFYYQLIENSQIDFNDFGVTHGNWSQEGKVPDMIAYDENKIYLMCEYDGSYWMEDYPCSAEKIINSLIV